MGSIAKCTPETCMKQSIFLLWGSSADHKRSVRRVVYDGRKVGFCAKENPV